MSRTENLVSTDWAVENLTTPGLVFVEVDEDTAAYDGGHVPGAIKISWKDDLRDKVRYDFIDKAGLEKLFSEKGIGNDDTIVLYGGNNNWFAAYAYWFFTLYGHAEVKLIDGGRKKWELEGLPLSSDTVTREADQLHRQGRRPHRSARSATTPSPRSARRTWWTSARRASSPGQLGAPAHLPQENAQRRGHVPGAINIPWSKAANEDGTFKSDAELSEIYADAGFDDSKETIAYCRIGERSSHTWFVLSQLLGKKNVKNYDGSWLEYGSLVGVPIELGEPVSV